jgi:hypothetical protein
MVHKILGYISFEELNFSKSFSQGIKKIKRLNNLDKYMTIFWLLGPFIYLIERDPADLWLTSLAIIFLIRCKINKDWIWIDQWWVKFAVIFWSVSIISAILSPDPSYSLSQGIVWIRFPLYVAAAQVWLAKDKDIRILMFLSIVLGILLMNGILLAEVILEPNLPNFQPKQRLTWPYGDTVPGAYLAKLGLPVVCALFVMNVNKINILVSFFLIFTFLMVLLTGERTHLLLLICSCALSMFFWKPKLNKFLTLGTIIIGLICFLTYFHPQTIYRFSQLYKIAQNASLSETIRVKSSDFIPTNKSESLKLPLNKNSMYMFLDQILSFEDTKGKYGYNNYGEKFIKINNEIIKIGDFNSKESRLTVINRGFAGTKPSTHLATSKVILLLHKDFSYYELSKESQVKSGFASYWGSWRGGIQQGLDTPIFGIGPSGTRSTCKDLPKNTPNWLPGRNYCGNHPHNFYIQLFAETGILGLIFGSLMIFSIITSCFMAKIGNSNCLMSSITFIVPFGIFFPLQQYGSFFGQWGNLFLWFAIGFAISHYQGWIKKK